MFLDDGAFLLMGKRVPPVPRSISILQSLESLLTFEVFVFLQGFTTGSSRLYMQVWYAVESREDQGCVRRSEKQ